MSTKLIFLPNNPGLQNCACRKFVSIVIFRENARSMYHGVELAQVILNRCPRKNNPPSGLKVSEHLWCLVLGRLEAMPLIANNEINLRTEQLGRQNFQGFSALTNNVVFRTYDWNYVSLMRSNNSWVGTTNTIDLRRSYPMIRTWCVGLESDQPLRRWK